ncbi:MAG: response regulator transcription factor [Puia sp.]|nr:response regulator transcription factor [Puia sp.]
MKKYRLVIIDDHYDTLELLKYNLTNEDYEVKNFFNAVDALKYITVENTDLVITDWMLPEMDGLDLCKNLKGSSATRDIPVMMITGRNDEIDVVTALEIGAEDYITKPFRIREMLTRVKKVLRRRYSEEAGEAKKENKESIARGMLRIDLAAYKVYLHENLLDLTIGEFKLLELLARQPGKVFSRNQLIERINGTDYFATERSIDVQIVGLRKKLGAYKSALETVRSVGYRLNESALRI